MAKRLTEKLIDGKLHKRCFSCKEWLLLSEANFYKQRRSNDPGSPKRWYPECKVCARESKNVYRKSHLEYHHTCQRKSRDNNLLKRWKAFELLYAVLRSYKDVILLSYDDNAAKAAREVSHRVEAYVETEKDALLKSLLKTKIYQRVDMNNYQQVIHLLSGQDDKKYREINKWIREHQTPALKEA